MRLHSYPLGAALALVVSGAFLASPARAQDEPKGIKSEEYNFEIWLPKDSVDWDIKEIDSTAHPTLRAWFYSPFADDDSYASVQVFVQGLPSAMARKKLDRIADQWKDTVESGLANPRERKDLIEEWAGVDTYKCSVEGELGANIHHRQWMVLRNGKLLYTLVVDRHNKATKDEYLDKEIKSILGSFKFGELRKVTGDSKAKDDKAPGGDGKAAGGGGDQKPDDGPPVDPEKLKKAPVEMDFWRFKLMKPEGVVEEEVSKKDAEGGIKTKFTGKVNGVRIGIRVYAWSLKGLPGTYKMEKLMETRLKWFDERMKDKKEPDIDKRYEKHVPLADKAVRMNLSGRLNGNERWTYLIAECKNDRQYLIEIFTQLDVGDRVWGKKVEEFLKSFEPQKP